MVRIKGKLILAAVLALSVLAGCTAEQLTHGDRIVSDVNTATTGIAAVGQGPAGEVMPAWVRTALEAVGIAGGLAVVVWQRLRNTGLLEQLGTLTATGKAIVRGIDNATAVRASGADVVKEAILDEMRRKGIEQQGRETVRALKTV